MSPLRLALVQSDLVWGEADSNRHQLGTMLDTLQHPVDLIILPEMFTSAFDAEAKAVAETWPGPTLEWLQVQAQRHDAAITGSIATIDGGQRFNRLLFVTPDGEVRHYDKRHLFRMLGEDRRYAMGNQRLIVEWRGWRIFPLVCYDLRFPVWCRNTPDLNYDLMLFVANWPAPRTGIWSALLRARAIENLAFVAGVNRTGRDVRELVYEGASAVEAPDGCALLRTGRESGVYTCMLDRDWLQEFRNGFPAHLDADRFSLSD